MKNDLIAITFSQARQAYTACQALIMMRSISALLPESMRLLERSRQSNVIMHQLRTLTFPKNLTQTKILDLFSEILFADEHEGE